MDLLFIWATASSAFATRRTKASTAKISFLMLVKISFYRSENYKTTKISITDVQAPVQLMAEGTEVMLPFQLNQMHDIIRFRYLHHRRSIDRRHPRIQRNQKFFTPTLHTKRDLRRVGNHDRPHRQIVRTYRSDNKISRSGKNQRPPAAQGIACRTRGSRHNNAI